MAHIDCGVLVTDESDLHTTAESEFANGRIDANLFPEYARSEAARIEGMTDPSFAERHWARGVKAVLS